MLPLTAVKLTHHHEDGVEHCCLSDTDNHNDKDQGKTCQICNYTLSPFLSFEFSETPIYLSLVSFEPTIYLSDRILEIPHLYLLRAPPVA